MAVSLTFFWWLEWILSQDVMPLWGATATAFYAATVVKVVAMISEKAGERTAEIVGGVVKNLQNEFRSKGGL
jgi:hypothetical protein